jgi:hypothetical protein
MRRRVDGWLAEWDAMKRPSRPIGLPAVPPKVGRNEPCPCGSGKKYKKCHLDAGDAARSRAVAGDGLSPDALDAAAQLLRDKDAGKGPASQMVDYARPILDSTDGDSESTQAALTLAMLFWNLAITRDDAVREETLSEMALRLDEEERDEFAETAQMMIERHRMMFPEMHRAR